MYRVGISFRIKNAEGGKSPGGEYKGGKCRRLLNIISDIGNIVYEDYKEIR